MPPVVVHKNPKKPAKSYDDLINAGITPVKINLNPPKNVPALKFDNLKNPVVVPKQENNAGHIGLNEFANLLDLFTPHPFRDAKYIYGQVRKVDKAFEPYEQAFLNILGIKQHKLTEEDEYKLLTGDGETLKKFAENYKAIVTNRWVVLLTAAIATYATGNPELGALTLGVIQVTAEGAIIVADILIKYQKEIDKARQQLGDLVVKTTFELKDAKVIYKILDENIPLIEELIKLSDPEGKNPKLIDALDKYKDIKVHLHEIGENIDNINYDDEGLKNIIDVFADANERLGDVLGENDDIKAVREQLDRAKEINKPLEPYKPIVVHLFNDDGTPKETFAQKEESQIGMEKMPIYDGPKIDTVALKEDYLQNFM
jgi:hypothetical protein